MNWTSLEIKPRFYEVDSYEIVNNMYYIGWFEIGRFAIAEKVGLIDQRIIEEKIMFVVGEINIKYYKPIRFYDRVLIENALFYQSTGKLRFIHRIKNAASKVLLAEGESVTFCLKSGKMLLKLPDWINQKVLYFIDEVQGVK